MSSIVPTTQANRDNCTMLAIMQLTLFHNTDDKLRNDDRMMNQGHSRPGPLKPLQSILQGIKLGTTTSRAEKSPNLSHRISCRSVSLVGNLNMLILEIISMFDKHSQLPQPPNIFSRAARLPFAFNTRYAMIPSFNAIVYSKSIKRQTFKNSLKAND